jgi:hypothetical protein
MEAVGLAMVGAALAVAGYFGRRAVERASETERLQRLSLVLDIEQKLHGVQAVHGCCANAAAPPQEVAQGSHWR